MTFHLNFKSWIILYSPTFYILGENELNKIDVKPIELSFDELQDAELKRTRIKYKKSENPIIKQQLISLSGGGHPS